MRYFKLVIEVGRWLGMARSLYDQTNRILAMIGFIHGFDSDVVDGHDFIVVREREL
jgi:hypothetical protein